ncbi:hypothetical protein EKV64_16095 [Bacillus anthracis]|nr:hypothetical protein [Bacillus anthracis]
MNNNFIYKLCINYSFSFIKIMLNIYSNITFPKVNYRVFSQKRYSSAHFWNRIFSFYIYYF